MGTHVYDCKDAMVGTFGGMQREAQLALHLPQVIPHEKLILAQVYRLHSKPNKV